jgi:hypothetical protein
VNGLCNFEKRLNRITMQANLFSPALDHKEQALLHFSRFEVTQALENLVKAKSIDPDLADLDWLVTLCEFADSVGAHDRMSAGQTAQLWRAVDDLWKMGKIAAGAVNFLRKLLAQRLLPGKFTVEGFCAIEEKILHRGVCHLMLRQWEEAHHDLLQLVTEQQELAMPVHWAYFADAAYALKRWAEANLG